MFSGDLLFALGSNHSYEKKILCKLPVIHLAFAYSRIHAIQIFERNLFRAYGGVENSGHTVTLQILVFFANLKLKKLKILHSKLILISILNFEVGITSVKSL